MIATHKVTVVANRRAVPGWSEYRISQDMLTPGDAFALSVRFTAAAWELLERDQEITVFVDDVAVITGVIDEREKVPASGESGTMLEIRGRDKTGRLLDESAPLFKYGGLGVKELAEKIVGITDDVEPLFDRVVLSNTRNRTLMRSVRRGQARVVREPVTAGSVWRSINRPGGLQFERRAGKGSITHVVRPLLVDPGIDRGKREPKRVHPGATRWQVLEEWLTEARLIAWSSGDGKELVVGMPNYEQENQYWFHEAAAVGGSRGLSNCAIRVLESNAERYSQITCCGARTGGEGVSKMRSVVYDNPTNRIDGTGLGFKRRKALLITHDGARKQSDTLERAEREQLKRDAGALQVEVVAPGHGQRYRDDAPTLFAIDTMARVEDGDTGLRQDMLVTACEYTRAGDLTQTTLRLVPRGTLLTT